MINTVLFDLDGTLLKVTQEAFVGTYFGKLKKVFERLGFDADLAIKGVWIGTKAMITNDGAMLNHGRFWESFTKFMNLSDEQRKIAEESCDAFYIGEFDSVKEIVEPTDVPARLIPALRDKGYTVVLATNPLFPECAVTTRLNWLGLTPSDFALITHYANSRFCKPNLDYFREVTEKLGKSARECIMVGNNTAEDMVAEALGIDTFLVTNYMENDSGVDVQKYKNGSLEDLEAYLMSL